MGIHGATATFLGWPEYGRMLGAYLAGHPWNRETVTVKLDDPDHPLNAAFGGQGFQIADEIFQFRAPYSRDHLRVLLSLDTAKTDMKKPGQRLPSSMQRSTSRRISSLVPMSRIRVSAFPMMI